MAVIPSREYAAGVSSRSGRIRGSLVCAPCASKAAKAPYPGVFDHVGGEGGQVGDRRRDDRAEVTGLRYDALPLSHGQRGPATLRVCPQDPPRREIRPGSPSGTLSKDDVVGLGRLVHDLLPTVGTQPCIVRRDDREPALDEAQHLVPVVEVAHQRRRTVPADPTRTVRVHHDRPSPGRRLPRRDDDNSRRSHVATGRRPRVIQDPGRRDGVVSRRLLPDHRPRRGPGQRNRRIVERRPRYGVLPLQIELALDIAIGRLSGQGQPADSRGRGDQGDEVSHVTSPER